jgi:hypothetical protein
MDECASLGIAVPDLASVDLEDKNDYQEWMAQHSQLHQQQNIKLGIMS